jgi:SagB-type dehydrogenase family enzyme
MDDTHGLQFWRATELDQAHPGGRATGVAKPALEWPYEEAALLPLPPPDLALPPLDFHALMTERRTLRTYSREPLSLSQLSFLLWCSQGVTQHTPGARTLRTVPSAGACHAFETLLLVNNVADLTPGLYRFVATRHALTKAAVDAEAQENLRDSFRNLHLVTLSAVVFLWVADVARMTWQFGTRGWRYLLLDAGHICQNLHLAADVCGCGACSIGVFDDTDANAVLGLDGVTRMLVYAAAVGRKPV